MPVYYRNAIWLFPFSHDEVLYVDCNSKIIHKEINLSKVLLNKTASNGKVKLAWTDKQYLYFFSENKPFIFKYSPGTGVEIIDLSVKGDDAGLIRKQNIKLKYNKYSTPLWFEKDSSSLLDYFALIMSSKDINSSRVTLFNKNLNNFDGSAGKKSFQTIKNKLNTNH